LTGVFCTIGGTLVGIVDQKNQPDRWRYNKMLFDVALDTITGLWIQKI
jgi:hypothetical protein